jgi:hypothetical protein
MEQSTAAMTVALRVLNAINERRHPQPTDIEELRRLAPASADMALDDLACAVIRRAIERLEAQGRNQQGLDPKASAGEQ